VLMLVVRASFLHPLAPDLDGAVRGKKPGIHRSERLDGGAARVDAPVVVLLVKTQVKKGVPSRAFSTASKRLEVLPLVPIK
jgi:hypothetical protein